MLLTEPASPFLYPGQPFLKSVIRGGQGKPDVTFPILAISTARCYYYGGLIKQLAAEVQRGISIGNPGPDVEAGLGRFGLEPYFIEGVHY